MKLHVSVKQLGKKHPIIARQEIEIPIVQNEVSLKVLLESVVAEQVQRYNARLCEKNNTNPEDSSIHPPVLNYLKVLTDTGKAGFDTLYNQNQVNLQKAQETAIQGFSDGVFAVFLDDDELIYLDQIIELKSDQVFTFIRLTFLAGSYW